MRSNLYAQQLRGQNGTCRKNYMVFPNKIQLRIYYAITQRLLLWLSDQEKGKQTLRHSEPL